MNEEKLLNLRKKTEILCDIDTKDILNKKLILFLTNELEQILNYGSKKILIEIELKFLNNEELDKTILNLINNNMPLYNSIISYIYWRYNQSKKQIHLKDDLYKYISKNFKNNTQLSKDMIEYINWEYSNINNSFNIDVPTLKKYFKIKSNYNIRNIIKPLNFNIQCPCCNKIGFISIYSINKNDKEFHCVHYKHINIYTYKEYFNHSYLYCSCKICTEMKKIIINNIKK